MAPKDELAPARRPIDAFREAIRPAELMVRLFQLLDSDDGPVTGGALLLKLRASCAIAENEELLLLQNALFVGLIRESAPLKVRDLRRASLAHVLRQAVVASCTAYETYLDALLRERLPVVIALSGREFFPVGDEELAGFFDKLRFELEDVASLLGRDRDELGTFIAGKITSYAGRVNLGKPNGLYVVGRLLGLAEPWQSVADRLNRSSDDLRSVVGKAFSRRHAIVHRGDRSGPGEEQQEMTFSYASQAVDTLGHVCTALDEVIKEHVAALRRREEAARAAG